MSPVVMFGDMAKVSFGQMKKSKLELAYGFWLIVPDDLWALLDELEHSATATKYQQGLAGRARTVGLKALVNGSLGHPRLCIHGLPVTLHNHITRVVVVGK